MNVIGLIGGMSWESTVTYYEIMNREIAKALGGFHSAKIMMYNVDFAELEKNMSSGNWDGNAQILSDAAQRLEKAGARFIVIATNTMHKLVPKIEKTVHIPILHIADATAECIKRDGLKKVALLGTKFTMTQDFIKDRLTAAGLDVIVPDEKDIEFVNNVIFNELCLGKVLDSSRTEYKRIISDMKEKGAQGVILGCTEIGMLIGKNDSCLPVYDTTIIHATEAARHALMLQTKRLILRRWQESDAKDLYTYAKDPDIGPAAGWPVHHSEEESRNVIQKGLNGAEAYAICLKTDNRAIGAIELKLNGHTDKTERDDECEIGSWLAKPFWRQGITEEASKELIRHAFEDCGMNRIWGAYFDGNEKSKRLQEKLGFTYHQTIKDVEVKLLHEKRTEHINYLTKDDWIKNEILHKEL